MGLKRANAEMLKSPMYLHLKMGHFKKGYACDCGEELSESNIHSKTTCESNEALSNHIVFPTKSLLPDVRQNIDGSSHWALLIEIFKVNRSTLGPIAISGFTQLEEYTIVDMQALRNLGGVFEWAGLKEGHTLAILYAQSSGVSVSCVVNRVDSCMVFKEPLEDLKYEAEKLLNNMDLQSRNEDEECFGCGAKTKVIMQCGSCKLAKYCSRECQTKAWKLTHKNLCTQSEALLRLACLPRQQKNKKIFSFKLNSSDELPRYTYDSNFIQRSLNGKIIFENSRPTRTVPKAQFINKCGLCNKTNQDAYLDNGLPLTKTKCCSNWICDDEHTYKLQTFSENSCYRNHNRYTMCANHYDGKHTGDWKQCVKCKDSYPKLTYDEMYTNKFNFEKVTLKNKHEIMCCNCGFKSFSLSDFAGSNTDAGASHACCLGFTKFYCKKPACKSKGGFGNLKSNSAFMNNYANIFPTESSQRLISTSRSSAINSSRPVSDDASLSTASSTESSDKIGDDNKYNFVEEHLLQAEKMIKKARFSPALRCLSLTIDKLFRIESSIGKMTLNVQVKLAKVYTKRAQCYIKMAERFNKLRYANLCSDDILFLTKNSIFKEALDLNNNELQTTLDQMSNKSKEFISNRSSQNPATTNTNSNNNQRRRTQNNRRNRPRRPEVTTNENKENNEDADHIDVKNTTRNQEVLLVSTCSKLLDSKLAINALSEDDQCPICYIQWNNFVEPCVAGILPCGHACCATCLYNYSQACSSNKSDAGEEDNQEFCCVLCRKRISSNTMQDMARQVVNKRLINSFSEFGKHLPFEPKDYTDLLVSLLTKKNVEFDINRVESILFNMMGLVERRQTHENLEHDKKQEYFNLARKPVIKLQEEYAKLRLDLLDMNDTESVEWKKKKAELSELHWKLNSARKNAASDIFERMNSNGSMGAIIEYDNDGQEKASLLHIDMHGLHVNEAKERANEFVLPILPALKKIIIITGHGVHNETGSSVLKESLRKYFSDIKVRCEDLKKNKGALILQM